VSGGTQPPPKPITLPSDVIRQQQGVPEIKSPTFSTLAERQAATKDFNLGLTQEKTAAKNDFMNFMNNAEATGVPNFDMLPQKMTVSAMLALNMNAADMQEYGYKIVGGQWVQQNSIQAQKTAQTQQANANPQNSDFMQTGFMQQNAAEGVSFNNQLRWDPTTGSYQKIGKLVAQGKLDLKTGKSVNVKNKGGGNKGQQQQKTPQPQAQTIGSVTGNFNTAGG
jgi:hypothetical protein